MESLQFKASINYYQFKDADETIRVLKDKMNLTESEIVNDEEIEIEDGEGNIVTLYKGNYIFSTGHNIAMLFEIDFTTYSEKEAEKILKSLKMSEVK